VENSLPPFIDDEEFDEEIAAGAWGAGPPGPGSPWLLYLIMLGILIGIVLGMLD
jgi:hypothetical protein